MLAFVSVSIHRWDGDGRVTLVRVQCILGGAQASAVLPDREQTLRLWASPAWCTCMMLQPPPHLAVCIR